MALIDDVRRICQRLAPHGWADLFAAHGLDITVSDPEDLRQELAKQLLNIRRSLQGFEDFALEGTRGIEPEHPARSLLYHALASPSVTIDSQGNDLQQFPTLAEIDTVENYVFGAKPLLLRDLRERAQGSDLAIVVFAHEYRPASHTCHKRHADLVFARAGIARIGTHPALYLAKNRGFLPIVDGEPFGIRVSPARYAAYIAVKKKGSQAAFCPMNFHVVGNNAAGEPDEMGDARREFWMPVHKLFAGRECLADVPDLEVSLRAFHLNEKLRRIHLQLGRPARAGGRPRDTGIGRQDIDSPPFRFEEEIAALSPDPAMGFGTLLPVPHPLVEEAKNRDGNLITFKVPLNPQTLSSSLMITGNLNEARPAPEFVNVRRRLEENGEITDLNTRPDVERVVAGGNYQAVHFIDYTADGWIEAVCPQLEGDSHGLTGNLAAYSLVTAPDFFPTCDQRELTEWAATLPANLRNLVWRVRPINLSEHRIPANLQLPGGKFHPSDTTMTAVVPIFRDVTERQTNAQPSDALRHSPLPDDAAGIFDPGWDVARDVTDGTLHMASYGLGSPFPEDAKLCAALSTFWPAVAPDITRSLEPRPDLWLPITVSPLTDEENGQVGSLPWDGVPGPQIVRIGGREFAEYPSFAHVDYVTTAEKGRFSLALTSHVDLQQYQDRVLSMALVYLALQEDREHWLVLSFRTVTPGDDELVRAQREAQATLQGPTFRFEVSERTTAQESPSDFRKRIIPITQKKILFADPRNRRVLLNEDGTWRRAL